MTLTEPPAPPVATPALDLDFVRAQFPALETPWALFDNAGGSLPARHVIDRVAGYMAKYPIQLGASYDLSRQAGEEFSAGRRVVAELFNCEHDELLLGASATALIGILARSLRPLWEAGDRVIVTSLDHESNVGAWRALEAGGIEVVEWKFDNETCELRLEDLEPLLNERTRLVAFTHCANVIGTIHDVRRFTDRIRAAGALSCIDGVAFAPHRRVDVRALGADFYSASLYKVYGPHVGALFGRRELFREARGQSHFFVPETELLAKLEPGRMSYELVAGLVGIGEYLRALEAHHGGDAQGSACFDSVFERIALHEEELVRPLLAFLHEVDGVRVLGEPGPERERRVPTVAFILRGQPANALTERLDGHRLAARYGHFYAYRAIEQLGLLDSGGVVRISLAHYNSPAEIDRLIGALEQELSELL